MSVRWQHIQRSLLLRRVTKKKTPTRSRGRLLVVVVLFSSFTQNHSDTFASQWCVPCLRWLCVFQFRLSGQDYLCQDELRRSQQHFWVLRLCDAIANLKPVVKRTWSSVKSLCVCICLSVCCVCMSVFSFIL